MFLFIKLIFLLFLSSSIFANNNLKSNYSIKSNIIMLSDILHVKKKDDKQLFRIGADRYSKRIKREELLEILNRNGYKNYTSKYSYIQFTRQSPINTTHIKNALRKLYTKAYKHINITSVTVTPMHYLDTLPKNYTVLFNKYTSLSNKGVLSIKTQDNKKIFFNYKISATVTVLLTRDSIKKGSELSNINIKKNSIILTKFRAMPIQVLHVGKYQSKYNLKKDKILTIREVTGLYLVKRNSFVNVKLKSAGMIIFFSAKALQNGRLGDIIRVVEKNGKKIKVSVTGKNKAEMK